MSINRHNYEEFFILYMDNELSAPERRMVEGFVQQHPDLKEELDLLFQYKLVPDTEIVFDHKDELMIFEKQSSINSSNFQGWLLLYIDNELSASDKTDVEQWLAVNPQAKKELDIINKTKLEPEELVFVDKASLYRTEKRIPVWNWRVAAAILLLLAGGVTTAILVNRKSNKPEIVKTNPAEKKTEIAIDNSGKQDPVPEKLVDKKQNQHEISVPQIKNNEHPLAVKSVTPVRTIIKQDEEKDNKQSVIAKNEENKTNNLPTPEYNSTLKNSNQNDAVANVNTSKKDELTKPDVTRPTPQTYDIKRASYNSDETDVALDQPEGKKNKLRGFFRKVTRTFEKRTNMEATDDDDGKLLVAGLAIKLK